MQAAKPSPDSTEPSSGRGGGKRRGKTTAASADSPPGTVRVLRNRGAVFCRSNKSVKVHCKEESQSLHRGRGIPAGATGKNAPVLKPTKKQLPSKKASQIIPEAKMSKSKKGKGRPSSRASCTSPAAICKLEAEKETSACESPSAEVVPLCTTEDEKGALTESNNNFSDPDATADEDPPFRDDQNDLNDKPETNMKKIEQHAILQTEFKLEESDKEAEDLTEDEPTRTDVQSEAEGDDKKKSPKKKGRPQKDGTASQPPKRRKKPPVQYVRCDIEGCGTVLAHPRYLQHHIKYQHLLKKKYMCDFPSCGRLFRLQKQLLRHAKHHTDQRDFICEFCARAFKSSHNLTVHRMIHTGEKPIQCEICGFTCRQKASLNWHMKKHDSEASYQFSCSVCSKKFEKKDSVIAHKAKSHPQVLIAEAMAANGGSVIRNPTPVQETAMVLTQPGTPEESQEVEDRTLTPLKQVAPPLPPQTQVDVPQGQYLQLPTHHVIPQPPTLLHLTTAPLAPSTQLIQLSTLPVSTITAIPTPEQHSTLVTLSSVTTLAFPAPQQEVQWGREAEQEAQLPGEGELWDRVVVGGGEMMWEGNTEKKQEDEGIVWEREGERQILVQCAEDNQGDLI
ncbi:E3 ubiquitin-protein ligase ZFP91-like isoform X2 [Cheilinus undulatus]|uniref:E3 ubiquitin-protein ligase ZFP91-like isoform X2 n=1 Tax=Cheilinus undulatus TaxID=241271 RepID=UPI001BD65149|nr:E3 ubiquitin-protein ligase ZFP91-like isoform X2 [Cheilinus undulatus]